MRTIVPLESRIHGQQLNGRACAMHGARVCVQASSSDRNGPTCVETQVHYIYIYMHYIKINIYCFYLMIDLRVCESLNVFALVCPCVNHATTRSGPFLQLVSWSWGCCLQVMQKS